ncbi:MAG: hypothetical protein M3069_10415, partial [Chloroflexota bacterium]|nr:hypothetical protein [Chloroflexota bacterium]
VWLDGRERGRTPLTLEVDSGTHSVLLKARDAVDSQYAVHVGAEGATLEALLWRRQPRLTRLRPSLPGATLADVRVLADGALALSIALPPGRQLQAWRLNPQTGALEPLLTDVTGTRLRVAPDGRRAAFIGYDVGPRAASEDGSGSASPRTSVLWLASGDHVGSTTGWRPWLEPGEQLVDASWSVRGDRLLVVTGRDSTAGATSSRLWVVDADGQHGHAVLSLPSEIAPGSAVWSPDGQHVALLAHAGMVNAVCLVDLDGGFRYVADLEPSPGPPPAYLPASWDTDGGQLLVVAPHQRPPGAPSGWLQPDPQRGLYVANTSDPALYQLGDTDMDLAAWRQDGQVVGLGRLGANHSLAMRALEGSTSAQRLLELPLSPAPTYAALWDLERARLVLASPTPSGGVDYWLAAFGLEGER